jgi:hypothetical protein|tara:strand:- start:56 stop:280 length:225 start_codon:yes stop_codon:yes gene_type:complete
MSDLRIKPNTDNGDLPKEILPKEIRDKFRKIEHLKGYRDLLKMNWSGSSGDPIWDIKRTEKEIKDYFEKDNGQK